MTLPLATTTISVIRTETALGTDDVDRLLDSYGEDTGDPTTDVPPPRVVARGIRAHIGSPGGTERIVGGNQELVTYRMQSDPVDLAATDQVRDNSTGLVYEVVWAVPRNDIPALAYTQAALSRARGAA